MIASVIIVSGSYLAVDHCYTLPGLFESNSIKRMFHQNYKCIDFSEFVGKFFNVIKNDD